MEFQLVITKISVLNNIALVALGIVTKGKRTAEAVRFLNAFNLNRRSVRLIKINGSKF